MISNNVNDNNNINNNKSNKIIIIKLVIIMIVITIGIRELSVAVTIIAKQRSMIEPNDGEGKEDNGGDNPAPLKG